MSDIRYAIRRLGRDWPFTIPALLVLALGIGANTAVFTVVDRALFRPLQVTEVDGLVNLYQNQGRAAEPVGSSYPAYRDMAGVTDVFSGVAAFTWPLPVRFEDDERIGPGLIEYATPDYQAVHGLSLTSGRWFSPEENRVGAPGVAVLNHRTWREGFGSDPSILGRTVRIAGVPVTIVGVGPEGYSSSLHSGLVTDFWMPVAAAGAVSGFDGLLENRGANEFMVRGRLREGVTLSQAREAMTALGESLTREYPREDPGRGISVLRADEVLIHPQLDRMVDAGAGFLTIVVAMLLAIVCTNLATWLLVRGLARGKEVSVRLALGASRARVVRHLVVESTLLAGLGGALGYLFAVWTMAFVATLDLPVDVGGGLDHRILFFTVALSLLTGVAFGLAPALGATRGRLAPALRGDGDIGSGPGRRFGLKHALVAAQVVLSCVFLGVEGVYLRALRATQDADPGFEAERLAFVELDVAFVGYTADRSRRLVETLRERVGALPGVASVTSTVGRPPGWDGGGAAIVEGYQPTEEETVYLPWIWAEPEYFDAFGIPLVRGRGFSGADRPDTPPVAVVNESLARRYFGAADPVGRRVRIFPGSGTPDPAVPGTELEIVGVVPDVRTSLLDPPGPLLYRASRQGAPAPSTVVVRTEGDPTILLPAMQRAVRDLDASVPVVMATTVDRALAEELGPGRAVVAVVGALGILGLGLASLGLYAVVAFAVSRRSREIGIRTALGARRSEVVWTLSKDVSALMAGALAVGLGVAWLLVRSLGGLVSNLGQAEGVNLNAAPAADPVSFAAVALLMAIVGLTATLVPAWRAAGGRPLAALREL